MKKQLDSRISECIEATQMHIITLRDFRKQLARISVSTLVARVSMRVEWLDDVIEGLEITEAKLSDLRSNK